MERDLFPVGRETGGAKKVPAADHLNAKDIIEAVRKAMALKK